VGTSPFLTELFPTKVRGFSTGFCYSVGRGFGALLPIAVGFLADRTSLSLLIVGFTTTAYVVVFVAVIFLPETRGKAL
jgi:fucose permease